MPDCSMSSPENGFWVLVVDDDADVRSVLREVLEHAGYRVTGAKNGSDALECLRGLERLPDCIVLDLMMPVMSGYEFRSAQLADEVLATIPVVLLSAVSDRDGVADALGAAAILTKPVGLSALLDAVARQCG